MNPYSKYEFKLPVIMVLYTMMVQYESVICKLYNQNINNIYDISKGCSRNANILKTGCSRNANILKTTYSAFQSIKTLC